MSALETVALVVALTVVAVFFVATCMFFGAYLGAVSEGDRWVRGARHGVPVAHYNDGNAPDYYLVVSLDDVAPGVISNYDVTDKRTGRVFRVSVRPLE